MKETKTIQVYPSDGIVNATINEYGSFGWEVIGNQRCQEFDGTTHGIDGTTTQHYSTFNKITFTREKTCRCLKKNTMQLRIQLNHIRIISQY